MPAGLRVAMAAAVLALSSPAWGQSTDGGRSDLPGMKKDIFDEIKGNKRGGPKLQKVKERAECPKSDGLSPFSAMYIRKDEIFVKFEGSGEQCTKLLNIGGANISSLWAASKTCGSVGEWKRRVAEELSAIFFVGGYESWPKSENETIDVETEFGNYSVPILESNYATIKGCWARGCRCEQASSPVTRAVLLGFLIICLAGIGNDAFKATWENFKGESEDKKAKKDKKEKKEKKERKSKVDGSDSEASEKKEKKEKKDKKEKKSKKSEDGSDSESKSGKDDTEDAASEKSKEDLASEKEEKAQ